MNRLVWAMLTSLPTPVCIADSSYQLVTCHMWALSVTCVRCGVSPLQYEATYGRQEVVVKMMGFSMDGVDRETMARGVREIETLARASARCRNVCQMVGYTRGEGMIGLVMRRYPRSFADEIRSSGGPMGVDRVLRCGADRGTSHEWLL